MSKFLLLIASIVVATTSASCVTDKDCPSSYCQNDKTKTGPFTCHLCGDDCCELDTDCKGSYCVSDPTKTPPYFCHSSSSKKDFESLLSIKVVETAPSPGSGIPNLSPAAAADAKKVEEFLAKYQQVVAGVAIAVGLVFAFCGYRFFNMTLFLCGAAAAGFVSFVVLDSYQPNYQTSKPGVVLGVTLTLALIAGVLCVYLRKVGTFLAGAAGAASAAFMMNAAVLNKIPAPDAVPGLWLYFAVVVLGVIGGVLALKIERVVLVLSTSLAGSLAFVAGIGKFAGHFPTSASSFVDPTTHKVTHDAWVWAYACGFVVLVLVSTIVQFKTTVDRGTKLKEQKYKNSLLYTAPAQPQTTRAVYVDHVSGYNTAV